MEKNLECQELKGENIIYIIFQDGKIQHYNNYELLGSNNMATKMQRVKIGYKPKETDKTTIISGKLKHFFHKRTDQEDKIIEETF